MGEGQNREDGETARRRNGISAYRRVTDRTEVKRSLY